MIVDARSSADGPIVKRHDEFRGLPCTLIFLPRTDTARHETRDTAAQSRTHIFAPGHDLIILIP